MKRLLKPLFAICMIVLLVCCGIDSTSNDSDKSSIENQTPKEIMTFYALSDDFTYENNGALDMVVSNIECDASANLICEEFKQEILRNETLRFRSVEAVSENMGVNEKEPKIHFILDGEVSVGELLVPAIFDYEINRDNNHFYGKLNFKFPGIYNDISIIIKGSI